MAVTLPLVHSRIKVVTIGFTREEVVINTHKQVGSTRHLALCMQT